MTDPLSDFIRVLRGTAGLDGVRVLDFGAGIGVFPVVDYSEAGVREWMDRNYISYSDEVDERVDVVRVEEVAEPAGREIARQFGGIRLERPK